MIDMQNIGLTYSTVDPTIYDRFKSSGDAEIFEKLVMDLMLNKYSEDKELIEYILGLPKTKQRMAVLSIIDGDNVLWSKMNSYVNECNDKFEHIKDVVKIINQFVKDGDVEKKKFGEVMTPITLVREMLDTLPKEVWSNPSLKWLDPANGAGTFPFVVIYKLMNGLKEWEPDTEKRYKHIVEKMIYVCELQSRNVFLWLCGVDPKDEYTTNTYWGSFLEDGFDKHMKEVWRVDKFDIVVGNPPYNQMIDMDFLCKSHDISDIILYVHPSTWLLDEKGKQRKFTNTKEKVGRDLVSIKLFNGNKLFGIALFVPCVITYFNKNIQHNVISCVDSINNKTLVYNSIFEINKFSDNTLYPRIKEKILNKTKNDNVWKYYKDIERNRYKDFMISFTGIRGNVNLKSDESMIQNDFYTVVSVDRKVQNSSDIVGDSFLKFYFSTELECDNFLKYLKTKVVRFCLSVYKNNQNLHRGELSILPWFDFSKEWLESDIIGSIGFSPEEINFINDIIPDYYN